MENMQRVELEVEKHGREEERNKKNQQAVLVCHTLVMTLYYLFESYLDLHFLKEVLVLARQQ